MRLALSGTCCDNSADLDGIDVRADLILGGKFHCGSLNLIEASVASRVDMEEFQCDGDADLNGMKVGASLYLTKAKIGKSLTLIGAVIQQNVNLDGSQIKVTLDMERLECTGNVFLRDNGEYHKVYLLDAHIRGTLEIRNAVFEELLELTGLRAGYIWMVNGSRFPNGVKIADSKIEQNLEIGGASFGGTVDLTGLEVGATLVVGSPGHGMPVWDAASILIMRDANVSTLRALSFSDPTSWPAEAKMKLSGFTYERIAPQDEDSWNDTATLGNSLVAWLGRASENTQPYVQLAQVLQAHGQAGLADRVLYAGLERRRRKRWSFRRVGYELSRATIGYGIGYGYFRSLVWAAALTILGGFIFVPVMTGGWQEPGASFLFSLDQLLPVVSVAPGAEDVAKGITGWHHWYLAAHRSLGFLLGSFVVAGLTGITKR